MSEAVPFVALSLIDYHAKMRRCSICGCHWTKFPDLLSRLSNFNSESWASLHDEWVAVQGRPSFGLIIH